ncbi:MAG: UvrD-helicase domain-containing protein [Deltaproteobacteria bacterium]|nr:UvrD-helicase domain-containing protein [Deltaproteobacteria bacterium]
MKFIADFHIHSKYSMATAKNLDLENLYISASQKGIDIVGTGDFTHPAWFAEIEKKLIYDENGLLTLREDIKKECDTYIPQTCKRDVKFVLTSEISSIYKKNGKTRKNHNLIFAADLTQAKEINRRLDKIGNIKSDGRPILGLDAKNLLEIILEVGKENFLVPAHIWTPWFSLFGSKSGFDSIQECFEDLTEHIFALETGLSSDPAMNRLVSDLDKYTLISNSDAHSPAKLGREANLFDTEKTYKKIKEAMKSGDKKKFLGTLEFFPEEGKYHFDGHRKCGVSLHPNDTKLHNNLCPVCGEPLTLGVLHRVNDLADIAKAEKRDISKFPSYYSIIPLINIISSILQMGAGSKKALLTYNKAIETLGNEFLILNTLTKEDIEKANIPLLADAIEKVRNNKVILIPGYDGEYGRIKIFDEEERKRLLRQKSLFIIEAKKKEKAITPSFKKEKKPNVNPPKRQKTETLNSLQQKAVEQDNINLLITAGPGTGKTRTITEKIIRLITENKASYQQILAITFTDKAANEMKTRISASIKEKKMPQVTTFHSFCFKFLKNIDKNKNYKIINDYERKKIITDAIKKASVKEKNIPSAENIFNLISRAKQNLLKPHHNLSEQAIEISAESLSKIYNQYQKLLTFYKSYDFDDLILNTAAILTDDDQIKKEYQKKFKYIFIDEYQDINKGEYQIIKSLVSDNRENSIIAIGDPNQSIYGFRGADASYFKHFTKNFPNAKRITLTKNYRFPNYILKASNQIIENPNLVFNNNETEKEKKIKIISANSEKAEIEAIAKKIENRIGGYGYFSIDTGRATISAKSLMSFADFAVLYRTKSFAKNIAEIFEKRGIPYQIAQKEEILSKKGIKEILSFLKIIHQTAIYADIENIEKIIKPNIKKNSIEKFKEWSYKNNLPPNEAMEAAKIHPIANITNTDQLKLCQFFDKIKKYKTAAKKLSLSEQIEYIKNINHIKTTIEEKKNRNQIYKKILATADQSDNNINIFFRKIASLKDTDLYNELAEKVTLITIHAAKGLEFTTVFIAGCEDGYIPFKNFRRSDNNNNEEKRLLYVAMTRAKEALYITYSKKRKIYGKITNRVISPFIQQIDDGLKEEENPWTAVKKKKKKYIQQEITFKNGL